MQSMTGYGKARYNQDGISLEIEIKSINGRYLDLKISAPRELSFYEHTIRTKIGHILPRGSMEVKVNYHDSREPKIQVDSARLKKYHDVLRVALDDVGIAEPIPLQVLLADTDIIYIPNNLDEDALLQRALNETLEHAIDRIMESLYAEGEQIKAEFETSIIKIQDALANIETHIEPYKKELLQRLMQRIAELLDTANMENMEQRMMQEAAIYVDKYDVQEEISRLKSHLQRFSQTIHLENKEVGKTLNFILQEMHREANTLGSKFALIQTFDDILIIKEEIEKCREMSQNVC